MQRGKKFAAYDKDNRLIILGYNLRIVRGFANDRAGKIRHKQKRKD